MRGDPRVTLAALAMVAGLAGTIDAAYAQPVMPYPAVPPRQVEVVPPPPGRAFLWEPGHWQWEGRAYAWEPGRYVARQPHFARFILGQWSLRHVGWVWVPAHWR